MGNLILVKPSKELEKSIWEYRQEYFDFGETHINGSSGIAYYNDKDNVASRRTAISCGGILTSENIYEDKEQQIF